MGTVAAAVEQELGVAPRPGVEHGSVGVVQGQVLVVPEVAPQSAQIGAQRRVVVVGAEGIRVPQPPAALWQRAVGSEDVDSAAR